MFCYNSVFMKSIKQKGQILLKAENDIGNVRKPKKPQHKRHISQMSEKGVKILIGKFNKLDISKTTIDYEHLSKKCRERNVSFKEQDIYDLLYMASLGGGQNIANMIVEYNVTYTECGYDERLLLRDDKIVQTDKGEQNLCIVISLTQNEVITVYYNLPKDKHKSIDMRRYCQYPLNGI